jgi:hypothetical protein
MPWLSAVVTVGSLPEWSAHDIATSLSQVLPPATPAVISITKSSRILIAASDVKPL